MITVYEWERVFLLKNWKLEKILQPWKYNIFNFFWKYEIIKEYINDLNLEYNSNFKEILINQNKNLIEENFYNFDIWETEVWILYKNWKIEKLLKSSKNYLFWKWVWKLTCEIVDISKNIEIDKKDIKKFKTIINSSNNDIFYKTIYDYEKAILKINWEYKGVIDSGEYMFYNSIDKVEIFSYDMRVIKLDISGQEILTKDKIWVRINLFIYYSIENLEIFYKTYSQGLEYIYNECQLVIRWIIWEKTLDEILENKIILSESIQKVLIKNIEKSWIKIISTWIKDVILPWEMRTIVNKVIEAEKRSEINAIKRRDETASTRSLLNTSKLLEKNPILMRLKELETLENLIEKVGTVNISNWVDWFLKDFLKIWWDKT